MSFKDRPQNRPKPRPVTACACGDHVFAALNGPYVTLVSPEDRRLIEDRAWSSRPQDGGRKVYAVNQIDGVTMRLHRVVLGISESHVYADHVNGNGLDNRRYCTITMREQLRLSCPVRNAQNRRPHRNKPSGLPKGVHLASDCPAKPYRVRIMDGGKYRHVGYYATVREAAHAYNERASALHGKHAWLNDLSAIQEPAHAAGP